MRLARIGWKRNAYINLVGKPEGKRPLIRPRISFEVNIKTVSDKYDGMIWTEFI
jgi:hypothetical protein